MEQRPYMTMLLVLIVVQMTGVFYLIFNSPQNAYTNSNESSEIEQIIKKELQASLHQQEKNGQNSATSAAAYEDSQTLHAALRNIVREELIDFFSEIQANKLSSTNRSQPTIERSISGDKAGLTKMDEATIETAIAESGVIIDTAIATGVWTIENTMAIMTHASKLPSSQRQTLRKTLLDAITQQKLTLEGSLPVF